MKMIYKKYHFPHAPGGNLYEWKEAETIFEVEKNAKYMIKIMASAKNAQQNNSKDDDDLRIRLDNYEFGKYEIHDEQVSWKGFGTASSWDGASLKSGKKTIYFFVELKKGGHILKFFADETPRIHEIRIFEISEGEKFELEELKPADSVADVNKKGIPWINFVFLGVKPKDFIMSSTVKSAMQKNTTDGDNLKIVINGKILQNSRTPNSKKYQNFYFSGDLNKGKSKVLKLEAKTFEFLEDSIEFWYDGKPSFYLNFGFFESIEQWAKMVLPKKGVLLFYEMLLDLAVYGLSFNGYRYSSQLLKKSLSEEAEKIIYKNNTGLAKKIKKDPAYEKILSILEKQIKNGVLNGQIMLGDEEKGLDVDFQDKDLYFSLHGIKKIDFIASEEKNGKYKVDFPLFDVYDFNFENYDSLITAGVYMADKLEDAGIIKNFEIEIQLKDSITFDS